MKDDLAGVPPARTSAALAERIAARVGAGAPRVYAYAGNSTIIVRLVAPGAITG